MLHEFWMKALPCRLLRIEHNAPVSEWAGVVLDALDRR
jgi:hypothetical protein